MLSEKQVEARVFERLGSHVVLLSTAPDEFDDWFRIITFWTVIDELTQVGSMH